VTTTKKESTLIKKLLREDRARLREKNAVLAARAREILKTLPKPRKCPHCGALPGAACVNPKGKPYFWGAHVARVKASQ
jgi:hypothetical protein